MPSWSAVASPRDTAFERRWTFKRQWTPRSGPTFCVRCSAFDVRCSRPPIPRLPSWSAVASPRDTAFGRRWTFKWQWTPRSAPTFGVQCSVFDVQRFPQPPITPQQPSPPPSPALSGSWHQEVRQFSPYQVPKFPGRPHARCGRFRTPLWQSLPLCHIR